MSLPLGKSSMCHYLCLMQPVKLNLILTIPRIVPCIPINTFLISLLSYLYIFLWRTNVEVLSSQKSFDIPFNILTNINNSWEREFIRFKNIHIAEKISMYFWVVRIVNLKIQENRNYCKIFLWRMQPILLFLLSNFTFLSVALLQLKQCLWL